MSRHPRQPTPPEQYDSEYPHDDAEYEEPYDEGEYEQFERDFRTRDHHQRAPRQPAPRRPAPRQPDPNYRTKQVIGVIVVLILSLLAGCGAFQLVQSRHEAAVQNDGSSGDPQAAAPGAGSKDQAKAPSNRTTTPPSRSQKRIIADGQQLWAAQPLKNIHQDQGSSVVLPDGRTLWIFADTFQLYDDPKFFITSAGGVTDPGYWQVQYSMGERVKGVRYPAEFMPRTAEERADRRSGEWYQAVWPVGSTQLPDGRILISYAKYRVLLKTHEFNFMGSGLFTFKYRGYKKFRSGDQAKRIANDMWTIYDGEVRSPIYANGYVYFSQCQNLACYSLRTTPANLTKKSSYTWWTGDGWSTDRGLRAQVRVNTNHPGGNPSIVRLKNGVYAMADTEAGSVSTTGQLWVAPNPWGPWSSAASFPMAQCPAPGCYGLNLHPEASTGAYLRVSYATNAVGPFVRVQDVPVRVDPSGGWIQVT